MTDDGEGVVGEMTDVATGWTDVEVCALSDACTLCIQRVVWRLAKFLSSVRYWFTIYRVLMTNVDAFV